MSNNDLFSRDATCSSSRQCSDNDYLLKGNYLSEFTTEEEKALARENLGIDINSFKVSWGDIEGGLANIEKQSDLVEYINGKTNVSITSNDNSITVTSSPTQRNTFDLSKQVHSDGKTVFGTGTQLDPFTTMKPPKPAASRISVSLADIQAGYKEIDTWQNSSFIIDVESYDVLPSTFEFREIYSTNNYGESGFYHPEWIYYFTFTSSTNALKLRTTTNGSNNPNSESYVHIDQQITDWSAGNIYKCTPGVQINNEWTVETQTNTNSSDAYIVLSPSKKESGVRNPMYDHPSSQITQDDVCKADGKCSLAIGKRTTTYDGSDYSFTQGI